MFTRTFSRWLISLLVAAASLVIINVLLTRPTAQAKHAATLINCAGSIQACIDAAVDGDTIIIPEGTYTESLTLSKPVSLTGANSTTTILHAVAGQRVLTVTGATITNSTIISGITFTGGENFEACDDCAAGILLRNAARPKFENIRVFNNVAYLGGGFFANSDSPLLLINSEVISNYGDFNSGGIFAYSSTLIGGRIVGNYGGLLGYTFYVTGTEFRDNQGVGLYATTDALIMNAWIENNYPGAMVGNGSSIAIISGTTFISNTSFDDGGGLKIESGSAWIYNSRFISNTATGSGGGLRVDGPATIANSDFISNTTGNTGGGAYISGTATLIDSQFTSNFAAQSGGGLFASDAVTLTNADFLSNTAYYGGGLYANYTATLTKTNFISNSAGFGGGLFTENNLALNGGHFMGNHCFGPACGGGAILVDGAMATHAKLVIMGTQFIHNAATQPGSIGGAVYYGSNGVVYIANALFAHNTAQQYGAALFLNWGDIANLNHLTIADAPTNSIAAITVFSNIAVAINNSIIVNHAIGIQRLAGGVLEGHNLFFGNLTNTIGVVEAAPSFIGNPHFAGSAGDDYHLAFPSLAIDHGGNAGVYTDLDGNPRPVNRGFDIGAYEYQGPIVYLFLPIVRK